MSIASIFALFRGKWRFSRTLSDRATGASLGTVQGEANFSPIVPNAVCYVEEGELTNLLGLKLSTYREYIFKYDPEKDQISKQFSESGSEKGLFYFLKFHTSGAGLNAVSASGDHLCRNDQYKAIYEFITNDKQEPTHKFKLRYEVTGPKKNYISETTFEKM